MSQIFKENIPLLTKITGTTLTLASTFEGKTGRVTVGGRQYSVTSTITLNTATTGLNGLDTLYYIYAVRSTTAGFGIVASTVTPTVGPTGYTGWKEIGRFRTFLGSAAIAVVINRLIGENNPPTLGSQGGPNTDWVTYPPSFSNGGTQTSNTWFWKRDGSDLIIQAQTVWSGAGAASTLRASIPSGLSIDSIICPVGTTPGTGASIGSGNYSDAGVYSPLNAYAYDASNIGFTTEAFEVITGAELASGDVLSFNARIPIAELAGLWT